MKYFYIEPEVSGGLGDMTESNASVRPVEIKKLNYEFQGWLGDVLIEGFPVFILTSEAMNQLQVIGITGAQFSDVEITTTYEFEELQPGLALPSFVWLKPVGKAGQDDFAIAADRRLVISQTVLDTLSPLGLTHAKIEPFN